MVARQRPFYNIDALQLAALAHADVPISVLQTLAAIAEYRGAPLYSPNAGNDVSVNSSSVYVAPQVAQAYDTHIHSTHARR